MPMDAHALPPIYHGEVDVEALIPHPKNYNEHPEEQIEGLEESLEQFTQYKSITVQERPEGGFWIVTGHGVTQAARRRHEKRLRADIIPASWPPELVEAILIADNEHPKGSVPNSSRLATLLQSLQQKGLSLKSMGSSEVSLNKLLAEMRSKQSTSFLAQYIAPTPTTEGTDVEDDITSFSYGGDQARDGEIDQAHGDLHEWTPNAPDSGGEDAFPGQRNGAQGEAQPIYFNLTFTFVPEQRELVLKALGEVKKRYDLPTSQEALVQLCGLYLTQLPAS